MKRLRQKTIICGTTYKPYTRLVVLSTDLEMAIKSLTRRNFEHFWYIFTKMSTCGSPVCPLDRCVILYDVFQTFCARLVVLSTDPGP